jgi:hypothetical protein
MNRVLQFVRSGAIWATVWSVLIFGINQYGQWQAGKLKVDVWTPVIFAVIWVVVFAFVMFVKVLTAARIFGFSLGKQVGKKPMDKALSKAADDAIGGSRSEPPDK